MSMCEIRVNSQIAHPLPATREPALDALRLLFSYPYCNLVSEMFFRTRDYDEGFLLVGRCRDLLEIYMLDIPMEEFHRIESQVSFLELSLLDAQNRWQEYLDLFEVIFAEKRSPAYICHYQSGLWPNQTDIDRFGRYLLGYAPDGCALVHNLYLHDDRRAVIERKQKRLQAGKTTEHLKRHQKEKLTDAEIEKRYGEVRELFLRLKRIDCLYRK